MALINCSECKKEISDKAESCPNCGAPLKSSKPDKTLETQRAAVSQAKLNESLSTPFIIQIIIIAIALGVYQESWIVFFGTLIGLIIAIQIPVLGKILALILAILIGYFSYIFGAAIWGDNAGYVIGGIAFFTSLGVNLSGIDYLKDVSK